MGKAKISPIKAVTSEKEADAEDEDGEDDDAELLSRGCIGGLGHAI
jgi:hypothetical protein